MLPRQYLPKSLHAIAVILALATVLPVTEALALQPETAEIVFSGESLFLRKLFWASLPNKRQKSRDR
jgi:hypothetical protein